MVPSDQVAPRVIEFVLLSYFCSCLIFGPEGRAALSTCKESTLTSALLSLQLDKHPKQQRSQRNNQCNSEICL
ncbi:hypothetical protein Pmani_024121 [Petrolisthes manimaculis]|uniref:Uncharacterized protein n=1 Tax=Petrolisthes manimaculis TaxID=1843537 RepID=A0AAE1P883_9EUCA|nr:hypothetical protein Pmani_024121 [Petrolisthes manimaculis]